MNYLVQQIPKKLCLSLILIFVGVFASPVHYDHCHGGNVEYENYFFIVSALCLFPIIWVVPKFKYSISIWLLLFVLNHMGFQGYLNYAHSPDSPWPPKAFSRSAIGNLKTVLGDQRDYFEENGKYATLKELANSKRIDLRNVTSKYKYTDLFVPNGNFFAVIASPEDGYYYNLAPHFIVTSTWTIRVTTVKDHEFKNMPVNEKSLDKINNLPLAR